MSFLNFIKKLALLAILLLNVKIIAQPSVCVNASTSYSNILPQNGNSGPYYVTNSDVNSDGFDDLLVPFFNSNKVEVFFGNAVGVFSLSATYTTGTSPTALVVSDFNNDGKPDLAISSRNTINYQFWVRLGLGNGLFGAPVTYTTGINGQNIYSYDFNGDAFMDLCILGRNALSIALNNGSGAFSTTSTYTLNSQTSSATIADFNGDSKLDLLVACYTPCNIVLFAGSGIGTFSPTGTISINYPTDVCITSGDFNGDTFKDFALSRRLNSDLMIYNGNGAGSFSLSVTYSCNGKPEQIIAEDINNDSKTDLVTHGTGLISVFKGQGNGSFAPPVTYGAGYQLGPKYLTIGNFNSDGFKDFATSMGFDRIFTYFNTGNGDFKIPKCYNGPNSANLHTVGDFNNDGLKDIATANYSSTVVSILFNNGASDFTLGTTFTGTSNIITINALDLNSDNKMDLLIGTTSGFVNYYQGTGLGTFNLVSSWWQGAAILESYILDLNGDNLTDIAYTYSAGAGIYVNNGTGTLNSYGYINPAAVATNISSIAAGDFNNDGLKDLAVTVNGSNGYFIYLNSGSGFFSGIFSTFVNSQIATNLTAGDYDNDGNCDIAIATFDTLMLKKGNGTGNFTGWTAYRQTLGLVRKLRTLDFNGDQKLDILGLNSHGFVSVTTGNNNGSFNQWTHIMTHGHINYELADMNNDHTIDATTSGAAVSVIFSGLKPAPISGPYHVCPGSGTVTLSTSAAPGTFTWSTGATTASITVLPVTTSTYNLVVGGLYGCSASNTRTITVGNPTLSVSGTNSIICSGNTNTIICGGANNYTWSNGAISSSIVVSPVNITTYTVIGSDRANCTSTASYLQQVNTNPILTISGTNTVYCPGNPVILSCTGANNYTWSNGSSSSSVIVTPSVSVTYSLIGYSTSNCSATAAYTVFRGEFPLLNISGIENFLCAGNCATLSCSGANSYTWSTGAYAPITVVCPSVNTLYYVAGADIYNCTSTTSISQFVDACTGVGEHSGLSEMLIYPNPNSGKYYVQANTCVSFDLFTVTGQLIVHRELIEGKNTLEMHAVLPNGVYYIRLKNSTFERVSKIVIAR